MEITKENYDDIKFDMLMFLNEQIKDVPKTEAIKRAIKKQSFAALERIYRKQKR
jgi:hypothetical protein